MNIKSIITAALALFVSTACSGTKQKQTESSTSNEQLADKILANFFEEI